MVKKSLNMRLKNTNDYSKLISFSNSIEIRKTNIFNIDEPLRTPHFAGGSDCLVNRFSHRFGKSKILSTFTRTEKLEDIPVHIFTSESFHQAKLSYF